ncbi:D-alanyl-D-alanine carboxypeptidase [Aquirufa sp.]|jgi:D-alanyl-D-alanine carboxypeptidase/D-alanyl-D-alanine-endopeptidase (penicillin-binding protein 4)|uniref:D-alanyl-D-alanine carboxypeptidase n=1 Tax=Aquirufa sp. TaxID=2676249 RepID=UPI003782FA82
MKNLAFLFLLALVGCQSSHLQIAYNESSLAQRASGVMIKDLATGKVLFEKNADQYFMPASNMKLLTFLQANRIVGNKIPSFKYRETKDTLFFWGTGDISNLHPTIKNTALRDFLAASSKVLVYGAPLKQIPVLGTGWAWDDYNDHYSAEISDMPLYANLVNFSATAKRWRIMPDAFEAVSKTGSTLEVRRNWLKNQFELPVLQTQNYGSQDVPFITSPDMTAFLLTDTLHKSVETMPLAVHPDARIFYAGKMDSLYLPMLHESDNAVAEQLLVMIAAEKGWDPTKVIENLKKEPGNEFMKDIRWVDGSGLSRYNLIRPKDFIHILELLQKEVAPDRLRTLLPEASKTGTMRNVQDLNPGVRIWAKSGSFGNTYDLSGYYLTKEGKTLAFSILSNLGNNPVKDIKNSVVEFLKAIH